ncbi:MAG: hypothetical protein AVDCRST_MAG73-2103, partial [uncultured Thermomicrobiales bacterium]
ERLHDAVPRRRSGPHRSHHRPHLPDADRVARRVRPAPPPRHLAADRTAPRRPPRPTRRAALSDGARGAGGGV